MNPKKLSLPLMLIALPNIFFRGLTSNVHQRTWLHHVSIFDDRLRACLLTNRHEAYIR